ncbi:uncharacterized protein isoform X2 [Leptinotarsa decemlineata]|uniref:uncharacterized protein isoform X2 n=1 Tax=Leptinotarsa decemlineata TaxID=7539 RepID=UPI003D306EFC
MAKEMCEKGTYTSNIETDYDGECQRKRRRKVKQLTSESEASDDHMALPRGQNLVRKKFSVPSMNTSVSSTPTSSGTLNFSNKGIGQVASGSKTVSADSTPILKELTEIRFFMAESRAVLSRIENFMNSHDNKNNPSHVHTISENLNSIVKKLPYQTKQQLEEVDVMVQEPLHMNELMIFLYLAGGSNSHKSVYMAMQKIFAKNLAIFYSGQGKKKKIPFCSMKIYEAVVFRKRHNNVTDESIKKYGLREAPKVWNDTFNKFAAENNFKRSKHDCCLYHKENVWILIYVDDILVLGNSEDIEEVAKLLEDNFQVKNLGEIKLFLGMEITRLENKITRKIYRKTFNRIQYGKLYFKENTNGKRIPKQPRK